MNADLTTTSTRRHGHTVKEHVLTAPLVHGGTDLRTIDIFAREYIPDGGEALPALVFLQGGPGHGAPRPTSPTREITGWLGEALSGYRVILLDQRGTGRSTPVDAAVPLPADYLTHLRADSIVADAELLRVTLGEDPWALLGQSFGGFCITTYLSQHPEGVREAYLTGGLPGFAHDPHTRVDDIYRATYAKTAVRNERFFAQFPGTQQRIRDICRHLDTHEELLPTGERLSSRRFRLIGMNLGRTGGFDTLAYLLEEPFHTVGGMTRLRTPFLLRVADEIRFADAPLYAVIHESIYGMDRATNWSAHRIGESLPGFTDEIDDDDPVYLTGEHIRPWLFDEDPSLRPWKDAAHALAAKDDWTPLYDADALAATHDNGIRTAAAVYLDDIFVPFELSMETAGHIGGLRPHVTNRWEHNGIGMDGAGLFRTLRDLAWDH
ncbi:alpha/beta fold hydrolase [Corynebacterium terpenotabidum]|uniref:Proline imino-peptidase n=1 Tax=Corynebacterium terpenotabidum Y-11 TaxID=1200352 RepID=S4X9Z2_9CORY|nr:alpha/beta fold hydrolase [Corynebacterium terpenotabidum]AGP29937.1 proline imino-peptidase [Corynebacterium terpenotabidum Y-11]